MKFPTPSTFKFDPAIHAQKKSNKPSMTQPKQTLTIKQILERFTRGLPVNAEVKTPSYSTAPQFGDPDLEKMRHADLFEKEQFSKAFSQDLAQAKEHANKTAQDRAEKEHQEKTEATRKAIADYLASQEKKAPPA